MDAFKFTEKNEQLWKYLKYDMRTKQMVALGNIGVLKNFGKKIATLLKLEDPDAYTGQCWRGTSCTILANNGFAKDQIKRVSGHIKTKLQRLH